VLDAKGDSKGAEYNLRRALDLQAESRGSDSPDLAPDLIDLAELLHRNKSYAASAREYRRVLDIRKKSSPAADRNVATALSNLGLELYDAGDYAAAVPLLNDALPLQKKYLGENDSIVLLIQKVLTQIQLDARR
jgi:tetratricopeptide (TPR) repeat protein